MSFRMPQRHRADKNQNPLVQLFERLGGLWIPRANKPFDGWAYHAHFGYLPVEVKNSAGRRRAGAKDEYTPAQLKTINLLERHNAPRIIWRTEEDVYRSVGARRTA